MWGDVTIPDHVNHVLYLIVWALDREKIPGNRVTQPWLEKTRNGCGEMRLVMAKIYLRVFVQNHAQDLPDSSVA